MKLVSTILILLVGLTSLLVACSEEDKATLASLLDIDDALTFPSDLAVASVTAQDATPLQGSSLNGGFSTAAFDSSASIADKKSQISAIAGGTSAATCQVVLPNFTEQGNPSCYGPQLFYANHPDTMGPSPQDDDYDLTTMPSAPPNVADDGTLPTGDLGLWTATEAGGESCASSKLNQLINNTATYVDTALLTVAGIRCLMNVNGQSEPAIGSTLDLTSVLSTAIAAGNAGSSVTAATMTRSADVSGYPVFVYEIIMFLGGANTATITMKHSAASATDYYGRVNGKFANGMQMRAFSIEYQKATTTMKYDMLMTDYNTATPTTVFDSVGNVAINGDWTGNASRTIMNYDTAALTGAATYAWQAGVMDSEARVFNIYTGINGMNEEGCAFFGYGTGFDQMNGTAPDNTIGKFICNWAGPGNSHTGMATTAQKQCFQRDMTGKMTPTTTNIAYAPTNSCDKAMNQEGAAGGGMDYFRYSLTDPSMAMGGYAAEASWDDKTESDTVTNDLVDLTMDANYTTNYTAPTAPSLPSGF